MSMNVLFLQDRIIKAEARYVEFLISKGVRVDPSLRGFFRFLVFAASTNADFRETAKVRRVFLRASGTTIKRAREFLEEIGLIKVERRGSLRPRVQTIVRPTRLFTQVTGL